MVSITHGHGYLTDCNNTTSWGENESSLTAALTVLHGDIFQIEGTPDDAGDEYVYYEYDIDNISADIYTKALIRWKTSVSSNGLGALVQLVYVDTTVQNILPATGSTPQFSTTWQVASDDTLTGKTIDKVRFWANDEPASVDSGTYQVYYDFLLLHKNTFTFPNVGYGLDFTPPPRYATIPIPSRVGDISQGLGSESATVTASCDLDIDNATNDWKRPQGTLTPKDDYVNGEVFMEVAHRSYTEPWQWLDTGTEQFKATLETPVFRRMGDGHVLDLLFREYRLSCASHEYYYERFGLNL